MAQPGLDQTLVAPANPTQRAILLWLVESDARITALTRPFPISLNSVSKHIRVLEWAHGVRRHRVGQEHILFLCPKPLTEEARWIETQRNFWAQRLEALLLEEDRRTLQSPHTKEEP